MIQPAGGIDIRLGDEVLQRLLAGDRGKLADHTVGLVEQKESGHAGPL